VSETPFADARAAQLFAEGAAILDALWDDAVAMTRIAEHPAHHDARGTLAYAIVLLRRGDTARADRALRAVLALQETRAGDAHYGNVRWTLEQETISDLNGVEFALESLVHILRDHERDLEPDLARSVREAIALGLDEIDRLDVHPSYTNIALSDIANSVLGGQAIGSDQYVERGARRLDEWWAFTNASGAPHEYNSPTYCAVDIQRLAALAEHAADPTVALKARIAEERLWLHVAAHYHPRLVQIAGPHARSYFDGWSGAGGYLTLILWRLLGDDALRRPTPYAARTREEAHISIALDTYHCPAYVLDWLRENRYPLTVRETVHAARGADITTHMTPVYALGSASCEYAVGEPPEPSLQPTPLLLQFCREEAPGYATLFTRYVSGGGAPHAHVPGGPPEDRWDEGRPVAAQHGGRAIIAYGLRPRARPAAAYRLSLILLGVTPQTEIWAGGRPVPEFPAKLTPGEPVVIAAGDAYIAITPLEPTDMGLDAPVELRRDGHTLTLDIYNYRGPAKTFWEYASQGGAFFHGNVRNAAIIEVAGAGEYESFAAFRAHIAGARIADTTDGDLVREIAYASGGRALSMRYSLRDMRLLERKHDGVVYTAPMASAQTPSPVGAQPAAPATQQGADLPPMPSVQPPPPVGAQPAAPAPAQPAAPASAQPAAPTPGPAPAPRWLQSRDAIIELGQARLIAGAAPKWLFADDERQRYVFVNPSDDEDPLWLETPDTAIECDAFGFGRIEVHGPDAIIGIEAAGEIGAVRVRGTETLRLRINGTDVTDAMTQIADDVREFAGL
jgi:hypothetical protein